MGLENKLKQDIVQKPATESKILENLKPDIGATKLETLVVMDISAAVESSVESGNETGITSRTDGGKRSCGV